MKNRHSITLAMIISVLLGPVLLLSGCNFGGSNESRTYSGTMQSFEYEYGSFNNGAWHYRIIAFGSEVTEEGVTDEGATDKGATVYQFIARGSNGVDLNVEAYLNESEVTQLVQVIKDNGIFSWDGFDKSDSRILDGFSFSLSAEFSDGSLNAYGYELFPEGFEEGHTALRAYLEALAEKYDQGNDGPSLPASLFEFIGNDALPPLSDEYRP